MKLPLFLGLVLVLLVALSPNILTIDDEKDDYFFTTRRREPTITEVIEANFGRASQTAIRVFSCESGLRPDVSSKTNDHGIAQINLTAHWNKVPGRTREDKVSWLFDYKNNIRLAYQLYEASGLVPWRSSQHCWG